MDPEGTISSRVERTLWTVWNYITEAVNRLLRPEPTDTVSNHPDSNQEPAADKAEPADIVLAEDDKKQRKIDEENTHSTSPQLGLSRATVMWDLCTTEIELGHDEESTQHDGEKEESEGSREEAISRSGDPDAGEFVTDERVAEDKQEHQKLDRQVPHETSKKNENEECGNTRSAKLDNEDRAGSEEETEGAPAPICPNTEKTKIQDEVDGCERQLEADVHVESCMSKDVSLEEIEGVPKNEEDVVVLHEELEVLTSEAETEANEGERQAKNAFSDHENNLQMTFSYGGTVLEVSVPGEEIAMACRNESDAAEDVQDREDEGTMEEGEQEVVLEEEDEDEAENKQTLDEVSDQEHKIQAVTEDAQEQDNDEVLLDTKSETQEDVAKDNDVQIEPAAVETDRLQDLVVSENLGGKASDLSAVEILFDEDNIQEDDKDGVIETTLVTVKLEGETGQEVSREFKNSPQGLFEGQSVVLLELNPPTSEETQEGLPADNNEPGLEENTRVRFLEGDSREVWTSPLPEEAEREELESLQNSETDSLTIRNHTEEEQESREVNNFGLVEELQLETLIQEPPVEEDVQLLEGSMKTGIDHSEKEFLESGLRNEDDLQNEAEDDGLCEPKEYDAVSDSLEATREETFKILEAEVQKMMEVMDFQESVEREDTEQSGNRNSGVEGIPETAFLKLSLEPEDVDLQNVGIALEDQGWKVAQKAEEVLDLTVAEVVDDSTAEKDEKENTLITVRSLETENQESDSQEAYESESKHEEGTMEAPEEIQKLITESETSHEEETSCSISGPQDVIDREILDLWIQTVSKDDNNQQQPELQPQADPEVEPLNKEHTEISSLQTETEPVSDAEISSSTAESGFSDQSLSEWGTQNGETQQLSKSTSTGSLKGIHDMLGESVNLSELSTQLEAGSQDTLVKETTDAGESHLKDEESVTEKGLDLEQVRNLNQEADTTQEKKDEETGIQEEIDAKLEDLASHNDQKELKTDTSAVYHDQKTDGEITEPDSQNKHLESVRSRSGSGASSEEGIASSGSGSDETSIESEKTSLKFSMRPGDHIEVDGFMLDFTAQRSRIAVKNPRVRPPKDPRSLLNMPSVDPTPAVHLPVKAVAGVPLGGLGIGIKLPGLGAGFPVLKKTHQGVKDESSSDSISQETEVKQEEKIDPPKQDAAQPKPKWMPPRHPGFGNPLMSELKTKLKKTSND